LTGNQTITLSGDVSGSGATSISTTIGNNAVTLAKFQQISTSSFLGRVTAGTGNVEVLTGTQATTLIDVFTTSLKGLAPASGGGTTNFLRADGTWAAPPGGGGGGTTTFAVTFNNSGTGAASGTTFDGSVARTISFNTLGANKVITSGTAAPTGGVDGDIYLQYDVSLLTGSGTANQIAYFSSSTAVVGSNDYQWDNTNKILTVNGLFRGTVTANRQTASYTLVLGDNGKLIEMNVGSANNLTVPLNSSVAFPIGTQIDCIQYGAGQTTIVATSGVTINSQSGYLKIGVRYSAVTLIKIGTNEWYCIGNLVA
jgi:hypothetical protein